jgi:hypothetical protein
MTLLKWNVVWWMGVEKKTALGPYNKLIDTCTAYPAVMPATTGRAVEVVQSQVRTADAEDVQWVVLVSEIKKWRYEKTSNAKIPNAKISNEKTECIPKRKNLEKPNTEMSIYWTSKNVEKHQNLEISLRSQDYQKISWKCRNLDDEIQTRKK